MEAKIDGPPGETVSVKILSEEMSGAWNETVWLSALAVPPSGIWTNELVDPYVTLVSAEMTSAADVSAVDRPVTVVLACGVPGLSVMYSSNPLLIPSLLKLSTLRARDASLSTALIAIWARTLLKLLAKLTTKPLFPSRVTWAPPLSTAWGLALGELE